MKKQYIRSFLFTLIGLILSTLLYILMSPLIITQYLNKQHKRKKSENYPNLELNQQMME